MRHRHKTKKLQRNKAQRRALLANQACSLIEEGEIRTTLAKAKALRPIAEKMVTLGKKGINADSSGEKAKGVHDKIVIAYRGLTSPRGEILKPIQNEQQTRILQ